MGVTELWETIVEPWARTVCTRLTAAAPGVFGSYVDVDTDTDEYALVSAAQYGDFRVTLVEEIVREGVGDRFAVQLRYEDVDGVHEVACLPNNYTPDLWVDVERFADYLADYDRYEVDNVIREVVAMVLRPCVHTPDWTAAYHASGAEASREAGVLDVPCRRCGRGGSFRVMATAIDWDEPEA